MGASFFSLLRRKNAARTMKESMNRVSGRKEVGVGGGRETRDEIVFSVNREGGCKLVFPADTLTRQSASSASHLRC